MLDRLSLLLGRAYALRLEDLRREDGQTTVEYAIVVALVVAMAVAVFATLSGAVSTFMTNVGNFISNQIP